MKINIFKAQILDYVSSALCLAILITRITLERPSLQARRCRRRRNLNCHLCFFHEPDNQGQQELRGEHEERRVSFSLSPSPPKTLFGLELGLITNRDLPTKARRTSPAGPESQPTGGTEDDPPPRSRPIRVQVALVGVATEVAAQSRPEVSPISWLSYPNPSWPAYPITDIDLGENGETSFFMIRSVDTRNIFTCWDDNLWATSPVERGNFLVDTFDTSGKVALSFSANASHAIQGCVIYFGGSDQPLPRDEVAHRLGARRPCRQAPWSRPEPGASCSRKDPMARLMKLLALGYFERSKISYHDDGEKGLGPTVAHTVTRVPSRDWLYPKGEVRYSMHATSSGLMIKDGVIVISMSFWKGLDAVTCSLLECEVLATTPHRKVGGIIWTNGPNWGLIRGADEKFVASRSGLPGVETGRKNLRIAYFAFLQVNL
ncbi:hypothetical protein PG996_004181 [Apiospora saccharicola]|uniref:YTH domain-containing protein n=1 Tax=Apiospora saccharicola TaxID=335842 RepID=A0ABR1W3G2_9PEZI